MRHALIPAHILSTVGCGDAERSIENANNNQAKPMAQDDPQATWDDYHKRIRARRVTEAKQMFAAMQANGVTIESILLLDFRHFSSDKADAENLGKQLSENYDIKLTHDTESNYWFADGTTRPDGISLTESQCIDWVTFMADVAKSHGCVFSTWRLTDAKTEASWSNESFEADTD